MLGSFGCHGRDRRERKPVRLGVPGSTEQANSPSGPVPVKVALGAVSTPLDNLAYYRQLIDYIGEKVGRPMMFVSEDSYDEVYDLLKLGKVDMAFISPRPYVEGHDDFGLELLAAPQVHGKTTYATYYIVPVDSRFNTLDEMRGRVFAMVDPISMSGGIVPRHRLAIMGITPESFFGSYLYSHNHARSIKMVAMKLVDGAAVDGNVWDFLSRDDPRYTSKTRVVDISEPFGIPPVVVPPGIDGELKKMLKWALITASENKEGRRILKGMLVDRFVEVEDGMYDSTRRIVRETSDLLFGS